MSDTKYDDIIGLPHYEPKYHQRMPMANRAAQFAPFAALTGHGAAIDETARLTDMKPELSAEQQHELSQRLTQVMERHTPVTITCFIPDSRKSGGRYADITGVIKKIDTIDRTLTLTDGQMLDLDSMIYLKVEDEKVKGLND